MSEFNRHRMLSVGAILFLSCASSSRADDQRAPPRPVSMIELIANKHAFDGKEIQVRGYLSVRFEDHALYLDKDAYGLTTTEDALWVSFDDSERDKFEKYDRHWGYLRGTFKFKDCNGHLCLYGGTIEHAKLGMMFKDK